MGLVRSFLRTVVATSVLTVSLVAAPTTAAATYESRDGSATNRTIESTGVSENVFEVTFNAGAVGEMRRLRSRIEVSHSDAPSADEILFIGVTIACKADADTTSGWDEDQVISHGTNTENGSYVVMIPRFVYTAKEAGAHTCKLTAQSLRPRPSGSTGDQWVVIDSSATSATGGASYLEVTAPLSPGSGVGWNPVAPWTVVGNGTTAVDVAAWSPEFALPLTETQFSLAGDVGLTSCTAEGGSDDPHVEPNGTPEANLCDGIADPGRTSMVKVSVQALQRAVGGGFCATTSQSKTVAISTDLHHTTAYLGSLVTASTDSSCERTFRLKIYVKHLSGPPVVVETDTAMTVAIL